MELRWSVVLGALISSVCDPFSQITVSLHRSQKKMTYRLWEICIYTIIAATGICQTITLGASIIKHILNSWFGGVMGLLFVFYIDPALTFSI